MKQASREAATSPLAPPWHPATPSYPALFCASWVAGLSGAGQNQGMTRYRPRAVLLLFLLLNLTACSSWQNIGPVSPGRFIELDQPERVRVTMQDGTQMELDRPVVDGGQLVAPDVSRPLADVLMLEVQRFDVARTILRVGGAVTAAFVVYAGLFWPDN